MSLSAKVAWRALVTTDTGWYSPEPLEALLDDLDREPDCVNAEKIILNASGVVQGDPLLYDGEIDERYMDAIRALAAAAGVDANGDLPTEPS